MTELVINLVDKKPVNPTNLTVPTRDNSSTTSVWDEQNVGGRNPDEEISAEAFFAKLDNGNVLKTGNSPSLFGNSNISIQQRELPIGNEINTTPHKLNRKHTRRDFQRIVADLRAFASKSGIDFDKLSRQEKIFYAKLALAHQKGFINDAEYFVLSSDFLSDDVRAKIQANIDFSEIDNAKIARIRNWTNDAGKKEAFLSYVAAKNIRGKNPDDTRTRQERFLLMSARRTEASQQKLMEKLATLIPQNCPEDIVRQVFATTACFSQEKMSSMLRLSKSFSCSASFQSALNKIAENIIVQSVSIAKEFTNKFFETAKGRAIRQYVKNAYMDLVQGKQKYTEQKKETQKLTLKMKEAEKISKKALEEAEYQKDLAEKALRQQGFKNLEELSSDKVSKLLNKQGMYSQQVEYEYSISKNKKAQEAAADAASKKRLADAFLAIDLKSLQFAAQRFTVKMEALSRFLS